METRLKRARQRNRLNFNGATSSRIWKRGCALTKAAAHQDTSMEPHPHGYGNTIVERYGPEAAGVDLQWSHILTDMETLLAPSLLLRQVNLQWSHILTDMETSVTITDALFGKTLQWSHILTDM